jgi:predicted nucleotidyltransferase
MPPIVPQNTHNPLALSRTRAYPLPMTPVASNLEIQKRIMEMREQILSLGVASLSLFGSFARGEQNASSDVDILVEFQPGAKTFDHFMSLAMMLEDALGRTVELVTPQSLSRHMAPRILKEAERVRLVA